MAYNVNPLDRRSFLLQVTAAAAAAAGVSTGSARADQRVLLVVLGGGVRTRDTFRHPDATPNLKRIAEAGVLFSSCKVPIIQPAPAQRAIFCGVNENDPARASNLPPSMPTLFEYLRKDGGLLARDVWFVPSGTGATSMLAASDHVDYGADYGPSMFAPDAVISGALREALSKLEIDAPATADEARKFAELLAALDPGPASAVRAGSPGSEAMLALQRFIIEEVARKEETGPGLGDSRAIRAARALVFGARPRFVAVALRDATIAGRSEKDYLAVLRRNDAAIGKLWEDIEKNAASAADTNLILVSDHGRNRKAAPDGSLGYDDGSTDANRVALLCAGPAFKRKERIRAAVSTLDVTPTICHLLGTKATLAKGRIARVALR